MTTSWANMTPEQKARERAWTKRWKAANKDKVKKYNNQYYKINYPKMKTRCVRNARHRKTRLLAATPPWVDLKEIRGFYDGCPTGMHVDHTVPLRGRNVCGLHVAANLQYLTAAENFRKSNKHECS